VARIRTARDVGALIRSTREDRNWTLADLANRAEVSRRWLIQVEHGHPRAELANILRVLHTLDIALESRTPVSKRRAGRNPAQKQAKASSAAIELDRHLASFDEAR